MRLTKKQKDVLNVVAVVVAVAVAGFVAVVVAFAFVNGLITFVRFLRCLPTAVVLLLATLAINLTVFLVAYLRFKKAKKAKRKAKLASILPTSQTLSAKEQTAFFDDYNKLIFGALGLAYNKASAKAFKGKDEADAEQIYDLLYWSDVCFLAAKDGQTLRQFIANVVAYCLPLWAFDQRQVEQTTSLIIEQMDFVLSFFD